MDDLDYIPELDQINALLDYSRDGQGEALYKIYLNSFQIYRGKYLQYIQSNLKDIHIEYLVVSNFLDALNSSLGLKNSDQLSQKTVTQILDRRDILLRYYDNYVQTFRENYETTNGTFNMIDIHNMSLYIGLLFCFHPVLLEDKYINSYLYTYHFETEEAVSKSWPVFVNKGYFNEDNWMMCMFEDQHLYGVPAGNTIADGLNVCSAGFIGHDLDHINIILTADKEFDKEVVAKYHLNWEKKLYYAIKKDTLFTEKERSFLITSMFASLHEYGSVYFHLPPEDVILHLETDHHILEKEYDDRFRQREYDDQFRDAINYRERISLFPLEVVFEHFDRWAVCSIAGKIFDIIKGQPETVKYLLMKYLKDSGYIFEKNVFPDEDENESDYLANFTQPSLGRDRHFDRSRYDYMAFSIFFLSVLAYCRYKI